MRPTDDGKIGQLTDITPDRRPINGISVPDDRVNKENQTHHTSPSHVETCSRVPSCKNVSSRNIGAAQLVNYLQDAMGMGCSRE